MKGGGLSARALSLAGGTLTGALILADGTKDAPAVGWNNSRCGFYHVAGADTIRWATAGVSLHQFNQNGWVVNSGATLRWVAEANFDAAVTVDLVLARDAAAVLALKNGTTAQTLRVYGTTTGPKYAALSHDGTDGFVTAQGGGALALGVDSTKVWNIVYATGRFAAVSNYGFSHGISALATTATEGFFHLQSCAGAPTGVPASIPSGQVPFVFDTTNDRLYFYYDDGGGAGWHYISRTA